MEQYKKIYGRHEALVSSSLISLSDAEIDSAIPDTEPGWVIYTADLKTAKRKNLDGTWVEIERSSGGGSGGGTGEFYPDYVTDEDIDKLF